MILIDTDILIDAARNVNEAVNCLHQVEQQKLASAISSVTQMELIIGCRDKSELRFLDRFLESAPLGEAETIPISNGCPAALIEDILAIKGGAKQAG